MTVWGISFLIVSFEHFIEDPWWSFIYGIVNQLLFASIAFLAIAPFHFILNKKWGHILTAFLFGLIITFEMASSFYFIITLSPIDPMIFKFDWSQMKMIAGDFVVFKWYYLLLILPPFIYFSTYQLAKKTNPFLNKRLIFLWLLLFITSIAIGFQTKANQSIYGNLSQNKTYFFLKALFQTESKNTISWAQSVNEYQLIENKKFTSKEFPLQYKSSNKNTLDPFFSLEETPPNIVFIIVESLSSSFSGPNANEISYTPFLDSLSEHSLYFENSLATGERTFAALPSILGSLPHGKNGFSNERNGFPKSSSLLSWLKQNNYHSSFNYGGYGRFDYMDLFLNDQGVEKIYDRKEYDYSNSDKKTSIDPVPFGITDKELFNEVIKRHKTEKSTPYLDIILTLSMHYPFIIEQQDEFIKEAETLLNESNASAHIKEKHKKYLMPFSTIVYTDNVLRSYFNKRKLQKDHENTIYIILGDHMMGDIPHSNSLEKYRSPLIIYSTLLRRNKKVGAVNSHLDITPSVYQLLKNKYDFNPMKHIYWLGQPFDTLTSYRNKRNILFMRNDRTIQDFISGNYYISSNELYKIKPQLSLKPFQNEDKRNAMSHLKDVYQNIHEETVSKNKIVPSEQENELFKKDNLNVNINDTTEYSSIAVFEIPQNLNTIKINIELSFLKGWVKPAKNQEVNQPLLILAINRGEENYLWEKLDLELNKGNLEEPRSILYRVKNNLNFELKKGDYVSVYFWNFKREGKSYKTLVEEIQINGTE
jgi:uncharacterized sulfatase